MRTYHLHDGLSEAVMQHDDGSMVLVSLRARTKASKHGITHLVCQSYKGHTRPRDREMGRGIEVERDGEVNRQTAIGLAEAERSFAGRIAVIPHRAESMLEG